MKVGPMPIGPSLQDLKMILGARTVTELTRILMQSYGNVGSACKFQQVSVTVDESALVTHNRPSLCSHSWMMSVIDRRQSSVDY